MKHVLWIFGLLTVFGCSTNTSTTYSDKALFTITGGSSGNPSGVNYYVVLDEVEYEQETAIRLLEYASYVLEYRGLVEAMYEEDAEYVVVVSYQEYSRSNKQQYFQLTAGSKRLYESTGEFRPSWVAASIHTGKPKSQDKMLAMHALSIREHAGGNIPETGFSMAYDPNSKVVNFIEKKVEREVKRTMQMLESEQEQNP